MKQNRILHEGLEFGDLNGLISDTISIDQYKPKLGKEEETVVVALFVKHEKPAKELSRFIETGDLEHLDVEISPAPDEEGRYVVFVEFKREYNLYNHIKDMLLDINNIIEEKEYVWKYIPYHGKGKKKKFNEVNFRRDVVRSIIKYRKTVLVDNLEEE